MKVLIGCEFSGKVRDAFISLGYDAISCDLLPTETPGPHIQADIRTIDLSSFHLAILHIPCTHLASSGARWFAEKQEEQEEAINFARWAFTVPVPRVAIENPVGIISTRLGIKPSQIIQPWMFGEGEMKTTCLWLKNLPLLKPTKVVPGREQRIWKMSGSTKERGKERSRTYPGIAQAMASQWGNVSTPIQLELTYTTIAH